MEFVSTMDAAKETGLKVVVFGAPGIGKTRLLATTGDLDKTLIINAERGLLSLKDVDIKSKLIRSWKDLLDVQEYIRKHPRVFSWVCFDSISEIGAVILEKELEKTRAPRAAYGKTRQMIAPILRNFRNMDGINVVFTAKESTREKPDGTIVHRAELPGNKLTADLLHSVDEVFCLRYKRGASEPSLLCRGGAEYECKDRSGELDEDEPANLARIKKKIFGGKR